MRIGNGQQTRIEKVAPIAIQRWGELAMCIKAAEECAELGVQLCKKVGGSPTTREALIDEIADVLIMTHRLRLSFGETEVDDRIAFKLDRLEKALRA